MTRTAKPTMTFYYRGDSKGCYFGARWHKGYTTEKQGNFPPYKSKDACRAQAKLAGCKAVFVEKP